MQLHDVAAARAAANGDSSSANGAWQSLLSAAWSSLGQDNPGGGVQDLAEALKVALTKGLSSGQDLAPALAKALNDGLAKAAQTLTSQGVSASRAAHMVARFRRELSTALDALDPPGAGAAQGGASGASGGSSASSGSSGVSGASGSEDAAASGSVVAPVTSGAPADASAAIFESGSLRLVTAEGDRVTIRFREWAGAASATDSGSGLSSAALLTGGRIQISVQGNLNADELKAIDNLLSQVDSLANQFFSGDLQGAFGAAAALNADPGEIARYSLHLTYAQLGVGPQASTAPVAPAAPTSPTDTTGSANTSSGVASSDTSNSASTSADTPSASSTSTAVPATSSDSSSSSSAPSASSPPDTSNASSSDSPQQTIGSFIQDVLGKLAAATGGGSFTFSMKWKLELLATALPSYAPSSQAASAPSTQLASATLKSLAS